MDFNLHAIVLLTVYSLAIIASSLLGGWLPRLLHLTHTRIQTLISLVGGLMLGIAVFHLLPHSIFALGRERLDEVTWCMMLGMVIMFFMLRFFHFHQHEHDSSADFAAGWGHDHDCGHAHAHEHSHEHAHEHLPADGSATEPPVHALSWMGVLAGLSVHTLLDGVALASTVHVEAGHAHDSGWAWGLGVFLAIFLHKPLDAMSISSLMRAQGASPLQSTLVNLTFATMVPLGALLVILFGNIDGVIGASIAGWGLAFSAGVFLCIALSDLLPEMEFHTHNRWQLTLSMLLGIALAWGVGFLEPAHLHHDEGDHHHHDHHADGNE